MSEEINIFAYYGYMYLILGQTRKGLKRGVRPQVSRLGATLDAVVLARRTPEKIISPQSYYYIQQPPADVDKVIFGGGASDLEHSISPTD